MKRVLLLLGSLAVGTAGAGGHGVPEDEFWSVRLRLHMPTLEPEVVQLAVFDTDPTETYVREISRPRTQRIIEIAVEKSDRLDVRTSARLHMVAAWDRLFRDISGDQIYLVIGGAPNSTQTSIVSNSPGTRKWLVTKVRGEPDDPICWCIPFTTGEGRTASITLDETNRLDLDGLIRENFKPDW